MNLPEVRDEIDTEDLEESPFVDGETDSGEPKEDTDVAHDDLATLVGAEHDGSRVEVYSPESTATPR